MRRINICAFIAAHVWYLCSVEGYRTFSMKDLGSCSSNSSVEIKLSPMSWNSSGILISDWNSWYVPNLHCEVTLSPPPSYGVVVSIRTINLLPRAESPSSCQNYLEISSVRGFKNTRLCGFSNDPYEFQSYIYWGKTDIVFHTSDTGDNSLAAFQLTFTVVRRGYNWCFKEEKRCRNGHCIWRGLICDGHNNCGDLSDELDSFIAQCSALSSGESLAVILVTIVGALVLLTIAAYLRGPKISQQIERMSQCRRAACPRRDLPGPHQEEPSINTVPTISRLRTNYGSITGVLSSYDYSAAPPLDPPPRYDEIESLPVSSVQSSVIVEAPSTNSIRDTNVIEVNS
ncbi:hypothetical protein AVEN_166808-1 [Araneus ventricosus]|uniref:CUB domain-containing protein n=1 Tax=Araneus ventricosus TaxID=182803 RepID=A0A4Y2BR69_ARAVE|nr:hypothetical protein AVEN_166808-1 [Araneus ventricosus]